MGRVPLNYLLLGGQVLLFVTAVLLQSLEGILSQNATGSADSENGTEDNSSISWDYKDPTSPLVLCSYLVMYVPIFPPFKFGGQAYIDVEHTQVTCRALDGIECAEPRTFLRGNQPCIK
ncbi:TM2D2 protein, partial [Polypterus senegalus]